MGLVSSAAPAPGGRKRGWVTSDSTMEILGSSLRCLPRELLREIVSYLLFSDCPPTHSPLPSTILNWAPQTSFKNRASFLDNLIGSSVYLVHRRQSILQQQLSGPIARSPFLIVWATVHRVHHALSHTYFGLIFPSVEFNGTSLCFGPAQDSKTLDMPRQDCSLVFYDLDVAQQNMSQLLQPDIDHSICRIRSLNIASSHNKKHTNQNNQNNHNEVGNEGPSLFPVLVARIPQLIQDDDTTPFHERVFTIDLFAPANHHLWPWN